MRGGSNNACYAPRHKHQRSWRFRAPQKTRETTNLSQIPTSSRPPYSQEKNASRKATTFSTQIENNKASSAPKCPMCTHEHYLNQCKEFRALSYQGRLEFANQQNLCRACLNGGHFARFCNRKHEACKKEGCKQIHTTLLHPPDKDKLDAATKSTKENETKQEVTNGFINLPQRERGLLPVVLVKIRVSGSVRYVVTQALLDTGSTRSFITEGLRKALKIEDCEEVSIRTITLNENRGNQMRKIVKNFEISDVDEIAPIQLSFLYSCKQLPVNSQDIPTQVDVDQLFEFKNVYIPQVKCRVGLLIGNNNRMILQNRRL